MEPSAASGSPLSRREALRLLAAGVAGSTVLPALATASSSHANVPRRIDRIGLQLYTVRTALSKDL
jgi:hypothetical protein